MRTRSCRRLPAVQTGPPWPRGCVFSWLKALEWKKRKAAATARKVRNRCNEWFLGGTIHYNDCAPCVQWPPPFAFSTRSEEHTSELQSQSNLVCRLLLEKKKKKNM